MKSKFSFNRYFTSHRLIHFFQITLVFTITFIVSGFFAFKGVDPHHDGILLKPAIDVTNGLSLFRESFTQYGALTTLIQSWFMQIFGKYLLTIRLSAAVFYGITAISLWHVSTRLMSKAMGLLTVTIWLALAHYYILNSLPWSSVYALAFQMIALSLVVEWDKNRHTGFLFLAGVMTACAMWCRQPVGVF